MKTEAEAEQEEGCIDGYKVCDYRLVEMENAPEHDSIDRSDWLFLEFQCRRCGELLFTAAPTRGGETVRLPAENCI
jgi:hypothetical protein